MEPSFHDMVLDDATFGPPELVEGDLVIPIVKLVITEGHPGLGDLRMMCIQGGKLVFEDVCVSCRRTGLYHPDWKERRLSGPYDPAIEQFDIGSKADLQRKVDGMREYVIGAGMIYSDVDKKAIVGWKIRAGRAKLFFR
ncbi:hypothetical protein [Haloferula sp. A504]|uniref:hypothetical protein n=1 Tax=Haloferula sp. A504 TaxID=3373601 RepID=UPI0031CA9EF0|nr:hypothetical protein [Verrucomicrobiaceae bacterium E54]